MPSPLAKSVFALLCLVGIVAVATGALLEISRARRGATLVTRNQFRLRLLSACVWLIILGSLGYAVLFLWPQPGDQVAARKFVSVVGGALWLLLIALLLFAYDVWQVGRQRRLQEMRFNQQLTALAREELERAQRNAPRGSESTSDAMTKPTTHSTDDAAS